MDYVLYGAIAWLLIGIVLVRATKWLLSREYPARVYKKAYFVYMMGATARTPRNRLERYCLMYYQFLLALPLRPVLAYTANALLWPGELLLLAHYREISEEYLLTVLSS
jgi:hypothetical protein